MLRRSYVAAVFAAAVSGNKEVGSSEAEGYQSVIESLTQMNRSIEELRFPVLFEAIVNRSVVLEHFSETHELRVHSIDKKSFNDIEVEVNEEALMVKSCNSTDKSCSANDTESEENTRVPPSLEPTDRLVRVDDQNVSMLSFQDVIDSPIGSVAVLPLFKSVGSTHVLSGFARVEILSPQMLEFEPATLQRANVILAWIEEKERIKLAHEARERKIANIKERQERLAEERRMAEAFAKHEQEILEKLDKEEFERTRMTPHNLVAGKRRDGYEFRYEVNFTTKGPIGLNWDRTTRDKSVVSHLEPNLPAQQLNVIASRDQLILLNEVDTLKMGPQEVVDVYLSLGLPRKMVFLVQMSAERAALKAVDPDSIKRIAMNWTLAFEAPEILRGWEVRLHLAKWSPPFQSSDQNSSSLLRFNFMTPLTGCNQFPETTLSTSNAPAGVVYLAYRGSCTLVEKAKHAQTANGQALLIVNNVNGEGRFSSSSAVVVDQVDIPVTLISKLDGELIMSVLEHQEILIRVYEENANQKSRLIEQPRKLTNQELAVAKDVKKSGRNMTFWSINASTLLTSKNNDDNLVSSFISYEFRVLPALFGANIPTAPFRVVAAYPQETACHRKGLGILATRAVIIVKRGGCSFGTKLRAIQDVGGAGMLLVNSDESLIPLMLDSRELEGLTTWGASISLTNGTAIFNVLAQSKTLPALVSIPARLNDPPTATTSSN